MASKTWKIQDSGGGWHTVSADKVAVDTPMVTFKDSGGDVVACFLHPRSITCAATGA